MKDIANATEAAVSVLQRIIDKGAIAVISLCLMGLGVAATRNWIVLSDIKEDVQRHRATVDAVTEIQRILAEHNARMQQTVVDIARRDGTFHKELALMRENVSKLRENTKGNMVRFDDYQRRWAASMGKATAMVEQVLGEQRTIREQIKLMLYTGSQEPRRSEGAQ